MTAVDHLIAALVELEQQSIEIEHRMSFVRAAIEAFGLDADSLLMDVIAEEERTVLRIDVPEAVVLPTSFMSSNDAPETAQQDDPEPPYGRTSAGRWDWDRVALEIKAADKVGCQRVAWLADVFEVPRTTAQWMVKRCREQGLIDIDRPTFTERNARDRAAAAL